MSVKRQPNFIFPPEAATPDVFEDSGLGAPLASFVVSRAPDGTLVSTYGELKWDFTGYHPELTPCTLNFQFWAANTPTAQEALLAAECRWVMFSLVWRAGGVPLAFETLNIYCGALRSLASFCNAEGQTIRAFFSSSVLPESFARVSTSTKFAATIYQLSKKLRFLDFVVASKSAFMALQRMAEARNVRRKQFAPMPTRVYSTVLGALSMELSEWSAVAPRLLELAARMSGDPLLGRKFGAQYRKVPGGIAARGPMRESFDVLAEKYGVASYLDDHGVALTAQGLSRALTNIQHVARMAIQAYTGMRDDESRSLPYDCLEIVKEQGASHYIVHGRTTKFNHGLPKPCRWVTGAMGAAAIAVARDVANLVYASQIGNVEDERFLFVSVNYLELREVPKPLEGRGHTLTSSLCDSPALRARLSPTITEADLVELEAIDPHRAWREEAQFRIGQPWPLVSHQFRRSLALYAQRSGLVSLPSLRRQLQHITDEMSRYYARGSAFATDFLSGTEGHFGSEWQETTAESSALGYIFNVLTSDDALAGGHGAWVARQERDEMGAVVYDRARTIKLFKRGEMAFKETLLGGCTNVGTCSQRAFDWLDVDCLADGCSHQVVRGPKLERVISALSRLVDTLDPNSLEYRTQKGHLDVLTAANVRLQQQ